jgi:hypothetical protein
MAAAESQRYYAFQLIRANAAILMALADRLLKTADAMISGVVAIAPDNSRLMEQQGKLLILFARHYQAMGDIKAAKAAERAMKYEATARTASWCRIARPTCNAAAQSSVKALETQTFVISNANRLRMRRTASYTNGRAEEKKLRQLFKSIFRG